jgi:hypothetical protein
MRQTLRQLRELQRLTLDTIRLPLAPGYKMRSRLRDGRAVRPMVAQFIKSNDRLSGFERIEIYNKQYWFRLLDCLYDDFPGMRTVLGEKKFHRLSVAYLDRYPSRHFSLRNLGQNLEQFLREQPQRASPYQALARDLARFEWAQVLAFDEAQKEVVTPDDLLGRDPAKLRLELQPHVTLLELNYPLDDFVIAVKRQALRGDASNAMSGKRAKHSARSAARPKRTHVYVAVYRQHNMIYYKRMEPMEYKIVCALRDGKTVGKACESVKGVNGAKVGTWFRQWAQLGWFCKP